MKNRVAVLISDNLVPGHNDARDDIFELDEQMSKLIPAFASKDIQLETLPWRQAAENAANYDAYLPLFVWDYFEGNQEAFLSEIAKSAQKTKIFNNFDVIRWNSEKSYLDELDSSGAPVIQTIYLDRVTETGIATAFETLDTNTLVIKPVIGGGAWRQVLYKQGDPFPSKDKLPPEGAMVQAFLPSVQSEGEYSFLYFGGHFSHGVLKRAKSGDYRIQSIYGGTEETYTPSNEERESARLILDALEFTPLYARVDLLRGNDGALKLIELELLEPYLYLPHAEEQDGLNKGALKLAEALAKKL